MEPTLQAALADVFGTAPPTLEQAAPNKPGTNGSSTTTTVAPNANQSQTAKDLLAQANEKFGAADVALRAGDLAGYQRNVQEGVALVQQAEAAS